MPVTRVYQVPDISCGHCKSAIEGELGKLEGVSVAVVDVEAKTVTVDGLVAEEAVTKAIADAGYEVAGVDHSSDPTQAEGGAGPAFPPPVP
jgi:copper chaperone